MNDREIIQNNTNANNYDNNSSEKEIMIKRNLEVLEQKVEEPQKLLSNSYNLENITLTSSEASTKCSKRELYDLYQDYYELKIPSIRETNENTNSLNTNTGASDIIKRLNEKYIPCEYNKSDALESSPQSNKKHNSFCKIYFEEMNSLRNE